MEDRSAQPFEDPDLKAALRRVLPTSDKTPASLRARIAEMAQTAAADRGFSTAENDGVAAPVAGTLGAKPRSPWKRLLMAAVILIGFGGLAYRIWEMNQPTQYDNATAISPYFYNDMVAAHVRRAAGEAGADTATTLAAAGSDLSKQLGRGVFVPDLSAEGWSFKGGAVRKIGTIDAAQLYYTKGEQSLSAVSLPTSAMRNSAEGARYDTVTSGTPIAGFAKGNGLFCIIGSKGLSVEELKQMLVKHEGQIAGS